MWPKSTTNVCASSQPAVQFRSRDQWLAGIDGDAIKAQQPTRNNTSQPTMTRSSWSEPQMSFDQAECGKLTAPATCGKLERQLQLIVSMPLE
jgi:hypothetical protein